ncbi:MAG: thioether cross-link-forming SCIFF peptide maturase [Clostridia bacterium]|nr:thioether cross-link-forming SCIFF peptide maturase [Clostridia bacterium]
MPDLLPVRLQDLLHPRKSGVQEIANGLELQRGRPTRAGVSRNWRRFGVPGARFLLDVQSGSLHCIDEAAWDVIGQLDEAVPRGAIAHIGADQIAEVAHDLDMLIEEGTLSYPDDPDTMPNTGQTLGPGVVKAMCLHVAHDCDMRCGYCFAGTGGFGGGRSLMPAEVGCAALDLLFKLSGGIRHLDVDFFGGEPLLNMEAVRTIVKHGRRLEAASGKVLKFTLTTNCLGLTPDIGGFLNDNNIAAVLSIDGRPAVHDAVRRTEHGGPTHERIMANALQFVQTRPDGEYYVRGTYTRRNLDFVDDVLYLADMGFDSISFEPVVSPPESPYSIREQDLPQVYASYDRLVDEMIARRRQGRGFRFFHFDLNLANGPCLAKRLLGCGAGREYVAVTPAGELYPCHQFVGRDGFIMGDVRSGIARPEIGSEFGRAHIYAKPVCRGCWARYMCSGGCHANAHQMNGTIAEPYSIGCRITRKRLESALTLAAAEATGDSRA